MVIFWFNEDSFKLSDVVLISLLTEARQHRFDLAHHFFFSKLQVVVGCFLWPAEPLTHVGCVLWLSYSDN